MTDITHRISAATRTVGSRPVEARRGADRTTAAYTGR